MGNSEQLRRDWLLKSKLVELQATADLCTAHGAVYSGLRIKGTAGVYVTTLFQLDGLYPKRFQPPTQADQDSVTATCTTIKAALAATGIHVTFTINDYVGYHTGQGSSLLILLPDDPGAKPDINIIWEPVKATQ